MAASVLVDLARNTSHSLAQHFRSYLSRHGGAPCTGVVRPRGVLFRGVTTEAAGGLRARNNGQQGGGGVEKRVQEKAKEVGEVREELYAWFCIRILYIRFFSPIAKIAKREN